MGTLKMSKFATGSDLGLTLVSSDREMISRITEGYCAPNQHNDIKGYWLASTDDTDLVNAEIDPDRSVNNNGLTVHGTITKTPVA